MKRADIIPGETYVISRDRELFRYYSSSRASRVIVVDTELRYRRERWSVGELIPSYYEMTREQKESAVERWWLEHTGVEDRFPKARPGTDGRILVKEYNPDGGKFGYRLVPTREFKMTAADFDVALIEHEKNRKAEAAARAAREAEEEQERQQLIAHLRGLGVKFSAGYKEEDQVDGTDVGEIDVYASRGRLSIDFATLNALIEGAYSLGVQIR